MSAIIHIKLDDENLNRELQADIFNMTTAKNFKLHDDYINDLITLDGDEGKLLYDIIEERQNKKM